jgi:hypothetical protein
MSVRKKYLETTLFYVLPKKGITDKVENSGQMALLYQHKTVKGFYLNNWSYQGGPLGAMP